MKVLRWLAFPFVTMWEIYMDAFWRFPPMTVRVCPKCLERLSKPRCDRCGGLL